MCIYIYIYICIRVRAVHAAGKTSKNNHKLNKPQINT